MSFTNQVKQEISRQIAAAGHCRKAELAALLSVCGTVEITADDMVFLTVQTDQEMVCLVILQLLKKGLSVDEEEIRFTQMLRAKTSVYRIEITDSAAAIRILQELQLLTEDLPVPDASKKKAPPLLEKACCRRAYLKGLFLASGTISDPSRSYHLEISGNSPEQAREIGNLLASLGIRSALVQRGKTALVYVKEGSQIADLLGMMDARVAMMDFENARIVREVRGNINRKVNFETANLKKAARTAAEQRREILFIEETVGLSCLPAALDEMARIRLQYPAATLEELGRYMDPPIGKSGVNHRMRKISAYARQLQAEQGGKRDHEE